MKYIAFINYALSRSLHWKDEQQKINKAKGLLSFAFWFYAWTVIIYVGRLISIDALNMVVGVLIAIPSYLLVSYSTSKVANHEKSVLIFNNMSKLKQALYSNFVVLLIFGSIPLFTYCAFWLNAF